MMSRLPAKLRFISPFTGWLGVFGFLGFLKFFFEPLWVLHFMFLFFLFFLLGFHPKYRLEYAEALRCTFGDPEKGSGARKK